MARKRKRKRQEVQLVQAMIAAGMIHPAIVFAAVVSAALRQCGSFSRIMTQGRKSHREEVTPLTP